MESLKSGNASGRKLGAQRLQCLDAGASELEDAFEGRQVFEKLREFRGSIGERPQGANPQGNHRGRLGDCDGAGGDREGVHEARERGQCMVKVAWAEVSIRGAATSG